MRNIRKLHGFAGAISGVALALMLATAGSVGIAAEEDAAAKTGDAAAKAAAPAAKADEGAASSDDAAAKAAPAARAAPSAKSAPTAKSAPAAKGGVAAEEGAAVKADDAAPKAPATKASPSVRAKVASASAESTLQGAQLRLGNSLIEKLSGPKAEPRNVIVSPASLALVFSLIDMGADDQMHAAIRKTLGFGVAKAPAKDDLAELRDLATKTLQRAAEGGPLALGNMIVFDPASKANPEAIEKLKAAGADVSEESLAKPETIERINGWVKEKTRGLIPTIIEQAPQDAGLVAINALYFKDRWKSPFDPATTKEEKFNVSQGQSVDVQMMHTDGKMTFRHDDKFVAVQLPYASGNYELIVVTSKGAPLGVREFATAASWLDGQGFSSSEGELALPRFSASGSADLLPILDALGLGAARKAPGALKKFSEASQTISRVLQKTELRVNEEGTEAAAATAVTTLRSATPRQYVKMIVDKPFLFALREKATGLVLLQGYIAKPEAMAEAK